MGVEATGVKAKGRSRFVPVLAVMIFLGLVVAAGFLGCTGTGDVDAVTIEQPYVFDMYFENHAWGYQLSGVYIDSDGNVMSYERTDERWTATVTEGRLSEAWLDARFAGARKIGTVKVSDLKRMYLKIPRSAAGHLTEPEVKMNDGGVFRYVCYRRVPGSAAYEEVLLQQDGDIFQRNQAPEAKSIRRWLSGIQSEYAELIP